MLPVSTPNAPADDPCQLPTATFALRKSFSLKNNLQSQIWFSSNLDHHGATTVSLTAVLAS